MKYAKRLAFRVIEGQAFIVDPKDKVMHSLNPTATRIWQSLGQGKEPRDIARSIAEEFEVDAGRALEDVRSFLEELRSKQLLEAGT